jgi:hypothetical protein
MFGSSYYTQSEFDREVERRVSEERSQAYRKEQNELRRAFDERQQELLAQAHQEYEEEQRRQQEQEEQRAYEEEHKIGNKLAPYGYGLLDTHEESQEYTLSMDLVLPVAYAVEHVDALEVAFDGLALLVRDAVLRWLRDYAPTGTRTTEVGLST